MFSVYIFEYDNCIIFHLAVKFEFSKIKFHIEYPEIFNDCPLLENNDMNISFNLHSDEKCLTINISKDFIDIIEEVNLRNTIKLHIPKTKSTLDSFLESIRNIQKLLTFYVN